MPPSRRPDGASSPARPSSFSHRNSTPSRWDATYAYRSICVSFHRRRDGPLLGRPEGIGRGARPLLAVPARQHRRAVSPASRAFLDLLPNRVITRPIGYSRLRGTRYVCTKGRPRPAVPGPSTEYRSVPDDDGNEVRPDPVSGILAKGNIPSGTTKTRRRPPRPSAPSTVRYATFRRLRDGRGGRHRHHARPRFRCRSTPAGRRYYPRRSRPRSWVTLTSSTPWWSALPDERYGQHVAAVVAPRAGTHPTLSALDAFAQPHCRLARCRGVCRLVDEVSGSPAGQNRDYTLWARKQTEQRPADEVHANASNRVGR